MTNKTPRVHISLKPDVLAELKDMADAIGVSHSTLAGMMVTTVIGSMDDDADPLSVIHGVIGDAVKEKARMKKASQRASTARKKGTGTKRRSAAR